MAAEIAMAESGGSQYAHSPTDDFGYWQINASNGALATYDALGNAKSAIILSDDGTNWSPWTTYTAGVRRPLLSPSARAGRPPSRRAA